MPGSVAAMSTGSGKSQTRYRVLGQVGLALECQRFFFGNVFSRFFKGRRACEMFRDAQMSALPTKREAP